MTGVRAPLMSAGAGLVAGVSARHPHAPTPETRGGAIVDKPGGMPEQLIRYWTAGPGGAKVGYGTPGQFDRLCALLAEATKGTLPEAVIKGLAAKLIHRVTGQWPGPHGRH